MSETDFFYIIECLKSLRSARRDLEQTVFDDLDLKFEWLEKYNQAINSLTILLKKRGV